MNRNRNGFAGRMATGFGLPLGLVKSIMAREGGFLGEDDFGLADISMLPNVSGEGIDDSALMTALAIEKDVGGRLKAVIRKIGSVPVQIPVEEFSDKNAAEAVRDVFLAIKAIEEGRKRIEELQTAMAEARELHSFEPSCLRYALWTKFPEFTGNHNIEIAGAGDIFQLVVDGEVVQEGREDIVEIPFGQAIFDRQAKLAEAKITISANDRLLGEVTTLVDAKERVLPHLQTRAEILVRKALSEGENFVGLAETKDGKSVIVISRKVDEAITEIPPEIKKELVFSHFGGKTLAPEVQEVLGIGSVITKIGEIVAKMK